MRRRYKYRSPQELAADMDTAYNSDTGQAALRAGFSTWYATSIIARRDLVRDDEETNRRERYLLPYRQTSLMGNPTPVGCGETNVVTSVSNKKPYWQDIAGFELGVEFCISDCDPRTVTSKMTQTEAQSGASSSLFDVGVSFGNLFNTFAFKGHDSLENWYGLFNHPVVVEESAFKDFSLEFTGAPDLSDKIKYDESALARFMAVNLRNFIQPRILMGPVQMEILGAAIRSSETCIERWQCMLTMLRNRGINTDNLFRSVEALDRVYGIDPTDPDNPKSVIVFIDDSSVGMPLGDYGDLIAQARGNKHAVKIITLEFGGLDIDRQQSVRGFWNLSPYAVIEEEYLRWYSMLPVEDRPSLDIR